MPSDASLKIYDLFAYGQGNWCVFPLLDCLDILRFCSQEGKFCSARVRKLGRLLHESWRVVFRYPMAVHSTRCYSHLSQRHQPVLTLIDSDRYAWVEMAVRQLALVVRPAVGITYSNMRTLQLGFFNKAPLNARFAISIMYGCVSQIVTVEKGAFRALSLLPLLKSLIQNWSHVLAGALDGIVDVTLQGGREFSLSNLCFLLRDWPLWC